MKKYLGVKLIEAEPCSQDQFAGAKNFGDLSKLSGGIDRDGYKVVYEDGYTSWSPKDVFEKAYKEIKPIEEFYELLKLDYNDGHQDRVINESVELNDKIERLDDFIDNNEIFKSLNKDEQERLIKQAQAMSYYFTILVERIKNF